MSMGLKIEIPVHQEKGWTSKSPGNGASPGGVRERLANRLNVSTPRTPEEQKKAEEHAQLLRQLHIEAVQARAARDNQRIAEAKARRLRMEATSRQRLEDRLDALASRESRLETDKIKLEQERLKKREAMALAVKEARAEREKARQDRAMDDANRSLNAAVKRGKLIQAIVDKQAYAVKHALAAAAAVKELEREYLASASEKLTAKLDKAEERRLETPKSQAAARASERARQVTVCLNEMAVKTEEKRKALITAQNRATDRRNELMSSVSSRASSSNERATNVAAQLRTGRLDEVCSARRHLFAKLNDAEVRRLAQRYQRSEESLEVITVEVHSNPLPSPPAELVKRLDTAPRQFDELVEALAKRHKAAALRAAASRSMKIKVAAKCTQNIAKATAVRAAAEHAAMVKIERRHVAAKHNIVDARAARIAFSKKSYQRVKAAEVRRGAAFAVVKRSAAMAALKRERAHGKRAALLLATSTSGSRQPKQQKVKEWRLAADLALVKMGQHLCTRLAQADARRVKALLGKASKAHFGTIKRSTPAKLTQTGGVLINSEPSSQESQPEAWDATLNLAFSRWRRHWEAGHLTRSSSWVDVKSDVDIQVEQAPARLSFGSILQRVLDAFWLRHFVAAEQV
eukprot:CAMPEP_0119330208 /NCGR_PEP_ID=MMETSP1333-20130426/77745_1 /TAXON_ID=418940 /ORGANISM="Scyphosphaera apsteinii, Strain RCC1455" /LENGTH=632 /DNA_ID=CAMNT_0007339547 /DNA_START=36 /DNA_END=1934 /DNA_ORIENTATION=+